MLRDRQPSDRGLVHSWNKRLFSTPKRPGWLRGPPNGYRGLFPGVKRPKFKADYTPQPSVQDNNARTHTSASHALMVRAGTTYPLLATQ
jgi:hypothetical protein